MNGIKPQKLHESKCSNQTYAMVQIWNDFTKVMKFPWVYIGLAENRFSLLAFSWNFHMTKQHHEPDF